MNTAFEQDKLLAARISDAVCDAQTRCRTRFIGFLDEHEAAYAVDVLRGLRCGTYRFFGGYEDAQRVFLGVFSQYNQLDDDCFPIASLTVCCRREDELTHRDFLGALLSLGVSRDSVGDILVKPGRTVVFATKPCAELAVNELTRVGRVGVRVSHGVSEPIDVKREFDVIEGTVACARMDCVAALVTKLSREKAAALIKAGAVSINGRQTDNISYKLSENDSFSVRGYGKYLYGGAEGVTRKGKQRVIVRKYK